MSGPGPADPGATGPGEVRLVDTPLGPARTTTTRPDGNMAGLLVLGHGAGGLRWTLDVLATRDAAVSVGWVVVLVDQPWRVAGKKVGPAPASLDVAWLPRDGDGVRLHWMQMDTIADTPSTSPAAWAFAVYVAT